MFPVHQDDCDIGLLHMEEIASEKTGDSNFLKVTRDLFSKSSSSLSQTNFLFRRGHFGLYAAEAVVS